MMAVGLLFAPVVFAQSEDDATSSASERAEAQVPTALGLFFRGMGERISLLFTFDALKKADKQIAFAEIRADIAEQVIEESDSERAREIAERMINRSTELVERALERKERWVEKEETKAQALLDRTARHEAQRQELLDRLEMNVVDGDDEQEYLEEKSEAVDKIHEFQEHINQRSRRLLQAIETEEIPEETRELLQMTKERIDAHAKEREAFREKFQALRDDEDQMDTEALRSLLLERREMIAERMKGVRRGRE